MACQSNHRQFAIAFAAYADDFRGYLPMPVEWGDIGGQWSITRWNEPINHGLLLAGGYITGFDVYYCTEFTAINSVLNYLTNVRSAGDRLAANWEDNDNDGTAFEPSLSSYSAAVHRSAAGGVPPGNRITDPLPKANGKIAAGRLEANTRLGGAANIGPILICHQDWGRNYGGAHGGDYSNILFADLSVAGLSHPWRQDLQYWHGSTDPTLYPKILAAHGGR
mgnify:CR=1 FL=1